MPEEILETPQPTQPIESKSTDWPKIILAAVFGFALLAASAYAGYYYGTQEISNLKNQISNLQFKVQNQVTPTPEPTPTPAPPVTPTPSEERVYKNEKYNFKFSYPEDWYFEGRLASSFKLEERESQIIITRTVHRGDGSTEDFSKVYTIYKADTRDKDDLAGWWKKSIKMEIGNHIVPTDYDTALNNVPFEGCIKEFDEGWQSPPALEVTAKEGVEEPGLYKGSIYFYYDFGNPFILGFTEVSSGACGNEGDYKVFTSISRLQ